MAVTSCLRGASGPHSLESAMVVGVSRRQLLLAAQSPDAAGAAAHNRAVWATR